MNPERIADYELVEYLTAGGMADLYLARGPRHAGPVVLKTIQKRYVEMTRVVRMFIDEGRIAKALDHPNIVRIDDVGEERGAYYIAMEFIAGRDLLAIARRGLEAGRFIPQHLVAAIVAQVANGLVYAHEKCDQAGQPLRIVHCDISPGNVVVSFGGTAKIVDFGIARAAIQLRNEDHSVAGKYNYMAPEQIRGEALDARADLFSLGVILYELVVGRRLFRGRPAEVKKRVLAGDVPRPRDVRPEISEELERIILRALATDREARYASARALRGDLLAHLLHDGHPAGKREIAEYLREIFVPSAQRTAQQLIGAEEEHTSVDRAPRGFDDDEELSLEAPVPGLAELVVDPDDPEPPPLDLAQETSPVAALPAEPVGEDHDPDDITAPDALVTSRLQAKLAASPAVPAGTDPTVVSLPPSTTTDSVTVRLPPAGRASPTADEAPDEPDGATLQVGALEAALLPGTDTTPVSDSDSGPITVPLPAKPKPSRSASPGQPANASRTELALVGLAVLVALAIYILLRI